MHAANLCLATVASEKERQMRLKILVLGKPGFVEVQLHQLIFGNTGGDFRLTASHSGQTEIEKKLQDLSWNICILMP